MRTITANDLKKHGIHYVGDEETLVTYRGKPKYLIIPESLIEEYENIRLEKAVESVYADIEAGRYTTDLDAHFEELDDV